jgi:hypothetical protein
MRTGVDIPKHDVQALDQVRRQRDCQVEERGHFGIWGEKGVDGVDYQRQLRAEW